jgi:exopolyphosphatase / guanosine-5'-triphosphate,3'-diphosphate pyrophosphatase
MVTRGGVALVGGAPRSLLLTRVTATYPGPDNAGAALVRLAGAKARGTVARAMRRACIDIGSNTTRLLVADCEGAMLREVQQTRVFTRIAPDLARDGVIPAGKIAAIVSAVCAQQAQARALGAAELRVVGTAAIRRAQNRDRLLDALRARCGLEVTVLTGEEEARLAFLGAAALLESPPRGSLGVVDVGGGSSELVVGTPPDQVYWWASLALGSGELAHELLCSDPPAASELEAVRQRAAEAFSGLEPPPPESALAVGGSATSLSVLAGPRLDAASFEQALAVLSGAPAADLARQFGLEPERVRLLPAGLLILQAAAEVLGCALRIGRGGLREGVLLAD